MTVSGSNTTEATITNLIPSTMYIVQVAAINDADDGVYSDPSLTVSTNDSTEHSTATIAMEVTTTTAQTGPYSSTSLTPTSELCNPYPLHNRI